MKVGIEQIRFFEDLAVQQKQVWNDAADYGVVLDGKDRLKEGIRINLRGILDTFEVNITKHNNDRTYEFFAAYDHEDGMFHGQRFEFIYCRLDRPYRGVSEIFTISAKLDSQKEHGWKKGEVTI
jgi:hypothetical protein